MRTKTGGYLLAAAMLAMGVSACNSDSDDLNETGFTSENIYSSTAITAFYLKPDTKIINNLDSCFFTIDLLQSKIFNADSLPCGTNVTKLVPSITTNGSSLIEISVSGSSVMNDTTFTYNSETPDSIDFTPPTKVTVRVVSVNTLYSQTYDIKVNVHRIKADSLEWGEIAWRDIPGTPDAQKTVNQGGKIFTLTQKGSDYTIRTSNSPEDAETATTATFPKSPEINTFTASDDAFYCLAADGDLMTSTDATSWVSTGKTWSHIYGGYGSSIIGIEKSGDDFYHVTYPDNGKRATVSADCPVSGTSQMLLIESIWAENQVAVVVGGRIANGNLTGASWAYDGNIWAKLSESAISTPYENMSLFPYFSVSDDGKWWRITKESAVFAMGGRKTDGSVSDTVYVSFDGGIHWDKAGESMQLPDIIPPFAEAQAIVRESTLGSRSAATMMWNAILTRRNPFSRAAETTWECPYIYLYGGVSDTGALYPTIWRGTINQLTFKPIE